MAVKPRCKLVIWGSYEYRWLLFRVIAALCCPGSLSNTKSSVQRSRAHQLCLRDRYPLLAHGAIASSQRVVFGRVNHNLVGHLVSRNHQFRDPVLRVNVASTGKRHLRLSSLHCMKVFVRLGKIVGVVRDTVDMCTTLWFFHRVSIVDVCNVRSSTASEIAGCHVNAQNSYPRTANVMSCSLASCVIIGNTLFQSSTNTHT